MEKWFVINKGADFAGIAKRFGISPVTARLIRNREVMGDEAIARYLKGGIGELYDPHLLLDSDRLTDILVQKISEQKKIRVIGDYDIDVDLYSVQRNHTLRWQCGFSDTGPDERWLRNQRSSD